MRIRNLDTFYWIASLGSFRAASEKLFLTQPAITARIQALEQDLGTEIFVKNLKRAELTAAGRRLFGFAERYMQLEADLLSTFSQTASIEQGIRIGASETIASTWLPEFLGDLNQSRENLSFDLRVDSTDNLRNALVSREIDLAFLMGPVAEVSIENQELCAFEMVFAASPKIAEQHDNWSIEDIASHPVLTFATNTKPSRQIREMLGPLTNHSPAMTTSTSLGAIVRLGVSGMGICALPRAVIKQELANRQLELVRTDVVLPAISFTASYVSASPANGLYSSIIEQIRNFLNPRLIKNIYQH